MSTRSPRRFVWVACVEQPHEEHAQTEANDQGRTPDEQVFHAHLLRADAVSALGLSHRGLHRPLVSGVLAVGGGERVEKIAHAQTPQT